MYNRYCVRVGNDDVFVLTNEPVPILRRVCDSIFDSYVLTKELGVCSGLSVIFDLHNNIPKNTGATVYTHDLDTFRQTLISLF